MFSRQLLDAIFTFFNSFDVFWELFFNLQVLLSDLLLKCFILLIQ